MEWIEVMRQRHSVRQYTDQKIPMEIQEKLKAEVERLNTESNLHMQLFFDEPDCFDSRMAHYGKFTNVKNYLSIVGKKEPKLDEKAGYYGEKVVLLAQSLGINSCWVGMTHGKSDAIVNKDEKQVIVVSLGYGENQGVAHKSKPMDKLCSVTGDVPTWFHTGMEAAMLSPTAVNQQKFLISYDGKKLSAKVNGRVFFSKVDLGIVKCDFELASGHTFDE
ncbi:nitroreductase family protein [Absicoccus intestinalis]|uniref:Nitroreductase n=1 Tax=Absicoccus intestinalis TaxID=2926319 RepID=A0ABU4WLX0_9FIRM|nr:nitroreductase family protein [Absicoccus sp. CLA-KB-P134]MDX8417546.1 nitroreductase [Absicoccus sp. CLA-KB-P134]